MLKFFTAGLWLQQEPLSDQDYRCFQATPGGFADGN